jgi:hypothetical protein
MQACTSLERPCSSLLYVQTNPSIPPPEVVCHHFPRSSSPRTSNPPLGARRSLCRRVKRCLCQANDLRLIARRGGSHLSAMTSAITRTPRTSSRPPSAAGVSRYVPVRPWTKMCLQPDIAPLLPDGIDLENPESTALQAGADMEPGPVNSWAATPPPSPQQLLRRRPEAERY